MAKKLANQSKKFLNSKDDFKKSCRLYDAPLPDGRFVKIKMPSMSALQDYESQDEFEGAASLAAAVVVDESGNNMFADSAEAGECLLLDQLKAISDFIGSALNTETVRKN